MEVAGRSAPRGGRHGAPPPLRPAQHRLRRVARKRGVRLDFLPEGFERRRLNTTEVEGLHHQLLWRVEWRLPLADAVVADAKYGPVWGDLVYGQVCEDLVYGPV